MSSIPPQSRSQRLKNNLLAQVLLATVWPIVRMQIATNQKPQLRRGGRNALDPSRLNKETRIFAERAPNGTMSRRWAISDCFFGNWGLRGTVGSKSSQKARRDTQDRQIQRSPAQVVVLAEAATEIEELLKEPRSHGNQELEGLERRDSAEHWVIRGNEEKAALLIAARRRPQLY